MHRRTKHVYSPLEAPRDGRLLVGSKGTENHVASYAVTVNRILGSRVCGYAKEQACVDTQKLSPARDSRKLGPYSWEHFPAQVVRHIECFFFSEFRLF